MVIKYINLLTTSTCIAPFRSVLWPITRLQQIRLLGLMLG